MSLGTVASRRSSAIRTACHLRPLSVLALVVSCLAGPLSTRVFASPVAPRDVRDQIGTISVDGRLRRYLLHLPLVRPSHPTALVLVLHGHGGSAGQARRISGMNALADREGFIVVYPQGTGWLGVHRSWNAGACCGYAMNRQIDDVAFIRALVDELLRAYPVDAQRIYVTGISNGGMMAYRLGCELSDRLAAIAPVAGALNTACTPTRPVSVIIFHGTADPYVPYAGGQGPAVHERRIDPPVASAVSFWVAHDHCTAIPQARERGHVLEHIYAGGTEGAEVILYTIRGGAHAWPGGRRGWWLGARPTAELSATEVMWEFFARHRKS